MSVSPLEKSPIDQEDYEGLQLDTRAKDTTEKHLDPLSAPQGLRDQDDSENEDDCLSEKQAAAVVSHPSPDSSSAQAGSSRAGLDIGTPVPIISDESSGYLSAPKVRRICGVRRRTFWILLVLILAIVVAAAIIGGAVGGTRHAPASTPSNNPSNASDLSSNASDLSIRPNVMIGSPLNVISYPGPAGQETLQMYFQSESGNIKGTGQTGSGLWQDALPIFTDAINNTGLATITYLGGNTSSNPSQQQGKIFYVGQISNGKTVLREKHNNVIGNTGSWGDGSLSHYEFPVLGIYDDSKHVNIWDGYRMAAVYSENFASGAGCRLFYHAGNATRSWVQELIWDKTNDTWTPGLIIDDVLSNSHLSATIDDNSQILRLFYVSKKEQLQHSYLNITEHNQRYQTGGFKENISDLGAGISSDISAVSHNGTTYVYYCSNSTLKTPTIREIKISGSPGPQESINGRQESFNDTNIAQVASPENNTFPYQPLTAVKGVEGWYVFWADNSTTLESTDSGFVNYSGYSSLSGRMTTVESTWLNATRFNVSLGHTDDDPHN